eukprot:scaffold13971_cov72-Skeletonema_marinoi.AAC.1
MSVARDVEKFAQNVIQRRDDAIDAKTDGAMTVVVNIVRMTPAYGIFVAIACRIPKAASNATNARKSGVISVRIIIVGMASTFQMVIPRLGIVTAVIVTIIGPTAEDVTEFTVTNAGGMT